ncbi:MAG: hypothetical protein FWD77_04500 [Betaproteobacteria bacterium]|nr:hypothetical protein [Betaproteobacteria bacterium]
MISDAQYARWLKQDGRHRVLLAEVECNHEGEEITRCLSDFGYVSNEHVSYQARIARGVEFSRQLAVTAEEMALTVSRGDLVLDNSDGALDSWLDDVWDKRSIRLYHGSPDWRRADFRPFFFGRIGRIKPQRNFIAFEIYDEMLRLNFPVSENKLGGDSDNKEMLVPLAFGECFNVVPLLVDEGQHEYQVNDGACEAVLEVRDNGDPISKCTIDAASGRFKMGQQPVGQITCDVQGALAGKNAAGEWPCSVAGIALELATGYGDARLRLSPAEIDMAIFNGFEAENPQPVGLYLPDRSSVFEAIDALCRSLCAAVYFGRDGRLRIWRMPSIESLSAAPARSIGRGDYEAGSFEISEIIPAAPAVKLGWGRNWTPTETGLAEGLPESSLSEFAKEWEEASATDEARVDLHRYTSSPEMEETLLAREADAAAEAARRLALRARPRKVVKVRCFACGFMLDLGEAVRIADERAGCWHKGVVIGLSEDTAADRVTVEALILPEAV